MKRFGYSLLIVSGILAGTWQTGALASHPKATQAMPPCEPGFQWMEVTEFKEVCREVCRVVPDVKKTTKWVYSQIEDPFCIKKCPLCHGHRHGQECEEGCPTCRGCHGGPRHRNLLVKRAVVCEEQITKCVVERIVEQVPCKTWRKVPCGTEAAMPPATTVPMPMPAPGPLVAPPVIK